MAQSLEQINQHLQQLEQQAIDLGEKLHLAHQGYRNVLAQTSQEQLIMSCFTLCTEAYPEEFLKLSVGERDKLQTEIRQFAQQLQQDLREIPHPQTPSEELAPATQSLGLPQILALPDKAHLSGDREASNAAVNADIADITDNSEADDSDDADQAGTEIEDILILDESDELSQDVLDESIELDESSDRAQSRGQQIEAELKALFSLESLLGQRQPELPKNPVEQVSFWHEQVDNQAEQSLRQVSSEINRLMQKRKILPGQIPAPILEAAALADSGEGFGKTPHLVRMILEAREKRNKKDKDDKPQRRRRDRDNSQPAAVVNIVTLQLRRSELEFHDTNLISWRNQIRTLLKELESITKDYKKHQQRQSIAQAKMAWRSTWTNE